MSDFKASIKIDIHFMGKDYNADMWINWDGPDNRAVYKWLSEVYEDGCTRYESENHKRYAAQVAAEEEARERAEYARLKEKYDPFPLRTLEKAVETARLTNE